MSKIERVLLKDAMKVGSPAFSFSVEVDEKLCNGCGKCAIECPSKIIEMVPREASGPCNSACIDTCFAANDMRDALKAYRERGDAEEAWRIITKTNPIPAVTGRTCPHPCEDECNRNSLDKGVNIHQFERFIGDYALEKGLAFKKPASGGKGSVAVVGSGPAGLGCAYHLALLGYQVTVYEAEAKPGGVLRYGIPGYRLPRDVLDREIKRIEDLGVEFQCGKRLGADIQLDGLKAKHKAVFLALGVQEEIGLGLAGEKSKNCLSGMRFLRSVAEGKAAETGNDVVVIGGGNVAVDSARSALRGGARNVSLVCLEKQHEMPAWDTEVEEALREGVKLVTGYGPMRFEEADGRIHAVIFKRCISVFNKEGRFSPEYDETERLEIPCESVIVSIGQKPADPGVLQKLGIRTLPSGHVVLEDDKTEATSADGVFAGGDIVRSERGGMIIGGVSMGLRAAKAIDAHIAGTSSEPGQDAAGTLSLTEQYYLQEIARNEMQSLPVAARFTTPAQEVNIAFNASTAQEEAKRCLQCGLGKAKYTGEQKSDTFNVACNNCHNCVDVCEPKAIRFSYYTKKKNGQWA